MATPGSQSSDSSSDSDTSSELDGLNKIQIGDDLHVVEAMENLNRVQPYRFEPTRAAVETGGAGVGSPNNNNNDAGRDENDRLNNVRWCRCGNCVAMPSVRESLCCQEVEHVQGKIKALGQDLNCITQHPGFQTVCLDVWVLQTAYYHYRQDYGEYQNPTPNERYRYTGYRQFVRWVYGYLGKNVRVVLPSCVVSRIRDTFESEEYTGFKYPEF